jgi:hypothetical protein
MQPKLSIQIALEIALGVKQIKDLTEIELNKLGVLVYHDSETLEQALESRELEIREACVDVIMNRFIPRGCAI